MIVQIYEITSVDEALRLVGVGVDHIGVVVGDGRFINEVRPFKAKEIFMSLPKGRKGVALIQLEDVSEIKKIISACEPDILHITGSMEEILPEHLEDIRKEFPDVEIMRTIPVIGEESVVAALMYAGVCDYLLLDTKDPSTGKIGVTGQTHDWNISRKIVESVQAKVILAGGLGNDNVQEAISLVQPYGVDSKTKTDQINGKGKDLIKVKMFVDKAKSENLSNG